MNITNFKLEDAIKSTGEPYVSKRDSTNLLNAMLIEETSRITVTKCFIESLVKPGKKCFATEFHVNWAMECIGYAFSLPIEHYMTISQAISIYKTWLLYPKISPTCIKLSQEYYRKEILGHLTLVFRKKKETRRQAELCSEVLNVIQSFIRLEGIEQGTWQCLIKLLLMTLNQTLTNYRELADYLSSKLIIVFFEVLIRSDNRENNLWVETRAHISEWIDHNCVISHWSAVVQALTIMVVDLVYGFPETTLRILFTASGKLRESPEALDIILTDEQAIYFWHRFLDLILVETKYSIKLLPDLHTTLSRCIVSIIDLILNICIQRVEAKSFSLKNLVMNKESERLSDILQQFYSVHFNYIIGQCRLPMPSINSILDIFGRWLFVHAKVVPAYDAFGKSELISVLCRVFSKAQGPANKDYLSIFYSILFESVANGDQRVVGEILKNSTELVANDLTGVDFLLRPDGFIQHLALYLGDKDTELSIRTPCYKVLATLSALPNSYRFKELSKHVVEIFLPALGLETDPDNFYILVWSMCVFASTVQNDTETLHSIMCAMVDRIGSLDYKDKVIYNYLLDAITVLPHMINTSIVTAQVVKRNIINIHAFIPKRGKSTEDDQTSGLLVALYNWLSFFPGVLQDSDLRFDILKVIENRKKIEKFCVLAECIQFNLMNNLKRPRIDETGINMASMKPPSINSTRRHYLNSGSVLSFFEGLGTMGITCRNPIGIYEWKLRMITTKPTKSQQFVLPTHSVQKNERYHIKSAPEIAEELFVGLSEREKNIFLIQDRLFKAQKKVKPVVSERIKTSVYRNSIYKKTPSFHRVFLSQLGLLDLENTGNLIPVKREDVENLFTRIDKILEKELVVFPVFYLATPEDKEVNIISSNNSFTLSFQKFLNSLGTSLTSNANQLKHLDQYISKFETIIYKSTALFESIAVAPALITSKKFNFLGLASKFPVIVLWNQRLNDPNSNKIPNIIEFVKLQTTAVIVLTSISEELIRVNVYGGAKMVGPLINQMVVPVSLLPKLLMMSVYKYETSIASHTSAWEERTTCINQLLDQKVNLEFIMNYLFN